MASTDAALVRRCLEGDRSGWAELIGRYGDLIYALLHRAGLDRTSAADAFQEVSILLWKSLKSLRNRAGLVSWIATTTRRVAWRTLARDRSRVGRDASAARAEAAPGRTPVETLAAIEEEQAVRQALSTLGERCRRLLSALYFDTADRADVGAYDDVAARLGIPRGSVGPTRLRCLESLRRELLALGFPEGGVSGAPRAASTPASDAVKRRPAVSR